MPSQSSEIAIYNMALDLLEEEAAVDPQDDRAPVRWLNRNYAPTRDSLLRQHPWNFAIRRIALPELQDRPAFGWRHQYQMPADTLRILPITDSGEFNGRPVPHVIEGLRILTNQPLTLKARYVRRVENTANFDPIFVELLATTLAMKMAHWMTGKRTLMETLTMMLREINENARLLDALEGTPEAVADNDWIDARFR